MQTPDQASHRAASDLFLAAYGICQRTCIQSMCHKSGKRHSVGSPAQPVFLLGVLDAAMLVVQDQKLHLLGLDCTARICTSI